MNIKRIVKKIGAEFEYYQEPKNLNKVFLEASREIYSSKSELDILEYFDKHEDEILSKLLSYKKENYGKYGYFCPFRFYDDGKKVKGFSYQEKGDTPLMKEIRMIAPSIPKIHNTLLDLHFNSFEVFSKKILELMEAKDTVRTRGTKDQGVDFWGWLKIPDSFLHNNEIKTYQKDFKFLVVGQSKKYKKDNKIGVSDVREVVGTVSALHNDQLSPWDSKIKIDNYKLMSPTLPLLMTTGYFTRDAKKLAEECGVVLKNGPETALFTALQGVGIREKVDGGKWFVKKDFHKWLNS